MQYAKQKDMIANLDKKLDYHNIQKEKHPYLNDLRKYMTRKKPNAKGAEATDYAEGSKYLST